VPSAQRHVKEIWAKRRKGERKMKRKLCLLLIAALAFSMFAVFPKFAYADPANFSYSYPLVEGTNFAYVGELKPGEWSDPVTVTVTIFKGSGEPITFPVTQTGGWFAEVTDSGGNEWNWPVEAAPGPTYTWESTTDKVTVNIRVQVPTDWTEGCVTFNVKLKQGYDSSKPQPKTIAPGEGVHFKVCVKIPSSAQPAATISGVKYYDANLNGERDPDEVAIAGWKIELYMWDEDVGDWVCVDTAYTGTSGDYNFTVTEAGTYRVVEVMPSGMWVQTAPESGYYEITVELGKTYSDNDFGNVCLMPGTGGKTLGFWSNKNGQALINSSDVTELNALNLYKLNGYPPFDTIDLTKAKTQIKNYLLSATAVNMSWMLSAQLIATKLNVLHGFLNGSTIVYVEPSTYVPSGFISIDKIMENANTALGGADRAEQEYWKNLLDGLNNNRLQFVCPGPCSIEYPTP
jgi:hypothetical protein